MPNKGKVQKKRLGDARSIAPNIEHEDISDILQTMKSKASGLSSIGNPSSSSSYDNNMEPRPVREASSSDVEIPQIPFCLGDAVEPFLSTKTPRKWQMINERYFFIRPRPISWPYRPYGVTRQNKTDSKFPRQHEKVRPCTSKSSFGGISKDGAPNRMGIPNEIDKKSGALETSETRQTSVNKFCSLKVDKQKTKHMAEDERKIYFEKNFLDSKDYSIKEEVHEKFRRFSWLSGAYGVTRPNRQIPYPHLYVTVKKGIKKSVVLRELKLEFNCDPKKYFEFRREPEKEPTFTYLSKPSSGGEILAISRESAPNRIPNEDEDKDEESGTLQQSGTLTMFCSLNGEQHYALTCLHIGFASDKQRFDLAFNAQDLFDIHNSIEEYTRYARENQEYCFLNTDENKNSNYTSLGDFHKSCFHCKSDIMSIKVKDVEVDCKLEKIEFPDWNKISKELQDRIYSVKSEDIVKVKKLGYSTNITQGYIVEYSFTFMHNKEPLFKEAVVVKGEPGSFLESGDSGALIRFLDKNKEEQAFAYGVCEVDELHADQMTDEDSDDGSEPGTSCEYACETDSSSVSEEVISENAKATSSDECNVCHTKDKRYDSAESITILDETGPYSICLKLKTALENLNLSNAGCFEECGGVKTGK